MLEDQHPAQPGSPPSPAELPASVTPGDGATAPAAVPAPDHAAGRIRRFTVHRRQWLTSEQARLQQELQARRQRSGMVDAGFLAQELDTRVGGGILAGALAFRIFLFMVPVVYVVFTALGVVSRALGDDPAQLASNAGITGILAGTVVKVADQSAWTLATLVLGAVVTMFITSGSLLKALYVVHWLIWRVPRVKPAGLAPKLVLIGLAIAGSALGVAVNDVRTSAGVAGPVLAVLLTAGLSFAGWWWVSWKLPHAPVPASALIPGAVLMAIGAEVLQLLTTYWIGNLVARKTSTYGAVGIALAVLLWVYILGRIMVASAGLNAALYYRRENPTGKADRVQLSRRDPPGRGAMVMAMRAITVIPAQKGSVALTEMPEPPQDDGPILVQTQAIGICGTDLEIINGDYGSAPPGEERLVIGHESLGRVVQAAPITGFNAGDLVVGIVRRRDPVPCPACAAGHWDMCLNGQYTERGIKGRHGYASERYRIHPEYLVAVDPALGLLGVLLEPTTVVAKAWDHIEKIGRRAAWAPENVLITGAGPIGLLAASLSVQRGYETFVLDLVTEGRKPEMVRRLGATYVHSGELGEAAKEADIVIECTGHIQMLLEAGPQHVRHRITCLTGVSAAGAEATVDPGLLNRNMVLQNSVLFGTVNANRRHYELAAQALARADPSWLADLITSEVPLERWEDAYTRRPDDIKTILSFQDASP